MARYKYSLDRKDAKIAGVCSTIGAMTGIDPTFVRVGFVAAAIFGSMPWTLVAYVALGIGLSIQNKRRVIGDPRKSDFERMGEIGSRRPSVHAMRTEMDANDRRMMAVDHHLATPNEDLAREIEALRSDKVEEHN